MVGDTSGTWLTTNGIGLRVDFGLGVGSTYSGTAGAWSANNYVSATGAVSVVGTSGATFYITGVQFEVGSQATSFDFRDYGRELILCQRYFFKNSSFPAYFNGSGDVIVTGYSTPSALRTTPTLSYSGTINAIIFGTATYTSTTQPNSISLSGTNAVVFVVSGFSGSPGSGSCGISGQTINFSAEL
jgi:hypothetical protein